MHCQIHTLPCLPHLHYDPIFVQFFGYMPEHMCTTSEGTTGHAAHVAIQTNPVSRSFTAALPSVLLPLPSWNTNRPSQLCASQYPLGPHSASFPQCRCKVSPCKLYIHMWRHALWLTCVSHRTAQYDGFSRKYCMMPKHNVCPHLCGFVYTTMTVCYLIIPDGVPSPSFFGSTHCRCHLTFPFLYPRWRCVRGTPPCYTGPYQWMNLLSQCSQHWHDIDLAKFSIGWESMVGIETAAQSSQICAQHGRDGFESVFSCARAHSARSGHLPICFSTSDPSQELTLSVWVVWHISCAPFKLSLCQAPTHPHLGETED